MRCSHPVSELQEELALQKEDVEAGAPRMLMETLPAAIEPGTSAGGFGQNLTPEQVAAQAKL